MFQVYEDKLQEETSVALRETKEGRELKIKQVTEQVTTVKIEKEKPILEVNPTLINVIPTSSHILQEIDEKKENVECPMSLEKSLTFTDSMKKDVRTRAEISKVIRTNFFEVNEYRADIYNYLRTAEVIIPLFYSEILLIKFHN